MSVLFADLVGFTTLSEHRDPEEVRELLSGYFKRCRLPIERYGAVGTRPLLAHALAERAARTGDPDSLREAHEIYSELADSAAA